MFLLGGIFKKKQQVDNEIQRRKKEAQKRRERETKGGKEESKFIAKLSNKLKIYDFILSNPKTKNVTIRVKEEKENIFDKLMAGKELNNYEIIKNGCEYTIKNKTLEI